jgi:hypothetical protein
MIHQTFVVNGQSYTISPDGDLSPGQRPWALISAKIIDELTGVPPKGAVGVVCEIPELFPRVSSDGLVGLAGVPLRAFSRLASQNYTVDLTIQASGYIPLRATVTVLSIPNFPNSFSPTDLGKVILHRRATTIKGRAGLAAGITFTPIPGATVTITDLWRTLPPAHLAVPPELPSMVSLKPPLYFARTAAAGLVRGRDMVLAAAQDKLLREDAPAGAQLLRLSDRVNLNIGDIIAVEPADPGRIEYMTIQRIAGASTADQPAEITLTYPLMNSHQRTGIVRRATPQPPGVTTPLAHDAIVGDSCVFLTTLNNLGPASVVELLGGNPPSEYHAASRFIATTDADGYYRLPPLSRVAQCDIQAHDGVHPDVSTTFVPNYDTPENRLDFAYQ